MQNFFHQQYTPEVWRRPWKMKVARLLPPCKKPLFSSLPFQQFDPGDKKVVAQLGAGDTFGEAALLLNVPSPVSIKATSISTAANAIQVRSLNRPWTSNKWNKWHKTWKKHVFQLGSSQLVSVFFLAAWEHFIVIGVPQRMRWYPTASDEGSGLEFLASVAHIWIFWFLIDHFLTSFSFRRRSAKNPPSSLCVLGGLLWAHGKDKSCLVQCLQRLSRTLWHEFSGGAFVTSDMKGIWSFRRNFCVFPKFFTWFTRKWLQEE